MPETFRIENPYPADWAASQKGRYVDRRHYDRLLPRRPCDVLKEDGSPLLLYRPAAVAPEVCDSSRAALRKAGAKRGGHRYWYSGNVGYFADPDCRATVFTARELNAWGEVLSFVRDVNAVFRRYSPARYGVQRRATLRTDPRWTIGDTAFTTGAVNLWDTTHDARTPAHIDQGDLREGFGVIAVLSRGEYSGGELIFPRYRVAVDLREGDVLLADVHEWHGNAAISGGKDWERIAVILYYMTVLLKCPREESRL